MDGRVEGQGIDKQKALPQGVLFVYLNKPDYRELHLVARPIAISQQTVGVTVRRRLEGPWEKSQRRSHWGMHRTVHRAGFVHHQWAWHA